MSETNNKKNKMNTAAKNLILETKKNFEVLDKDMENNDQKRH